MFELFYRGGPLFMGILSFILLIVVILIVLNIVSISGKSLNAIDSKRQQLSHIKSFGLLAMITGILGQLIGLYMAFDAIETAGDISPAIIYGGLKVSMITTLYGVFIYLFSILSWIALSYYLERKSQDRVME